MERDNKGGMDGMEGTERGTRSSGRIKYCELVVRILAMILTLIAAVVVGLNKQTKVVPVTLMSGTPPLNVTVYAKWHYLSAFVYLVVSNSIACAYAAFSLILCIISNKVNRKGGRGFTMIIILDLIMMALLFSSTGAAAAIGLLGYEGNSHVRWNKVCNVFGRFCNHIVVGLVMSLLGSIAFLLLTGIALWNLVNKSNVNWA